MLTKRGIATPILLDTSSALLSVIAAVRPFYSCLEHACSTRMVICPRSLHNSNQTVCCSGEQLVTGGTVLEGIV